MPLFIDNKPLTNIPDDVYTFLSKPETFKSSAHLLTSQSIREISPEKLVYVDQREYAVVSPKDDVINVIGSENATTCHITVLRCSGSGVTALAHLDGCQTKAAVLALVKSLTESSDESVTESSDESVTESSERSTDGRLELHLVGGFLDHKKHSEDLTKDILNACLEIPQSIHLQTACIGILNDVLKYNVHFPVIYGIAVDVNSGELFRATFPDQGPDMLLRSGTSFIGRHKLLEVYNSRNPGRLIIDPVEWRLWKDIDLWLNIPDSLLRKYLSTSPQQELPTFEVHTRNVLKFIQENPNPCQTLFVNNKSRIYQKEASGKWVKWTKL